MLFYVIRHGQTDWNFNRKMLGRTDVLMNKTGILQAKETAKKMEDISYDMVFCSPLQRTKQTCEIINVKQKEVIYDERIIEKDLGVIEGKFVDEFDYENYWKMNRKSYEKEETLEQLQQRVYDFLDEVQSNYHDKNILIVTHNGVCRFINTYFHKMPNDGNITNLGQDNCELKIYEI